MSRELARRIGFVLLSICVWWSPAGARSAIWFSCGLDEPARSILAGEPLLLAIVTVFSLRHPAMARAHGQCRGGRGDHRVVGEHRAIERPDWAADTARTATGNHRWRASHREQMYAICLA